MTELNDIQKLATDVQVLKSEVEQVASVNTKLDNINQRLDKINNKYQIMYSCSDGLYASDVDGYTNGDLIVSESALSDASGRLVRIDPFGNVSFSYGAGTFHIINDAKVINNDNLIISV